MGLCASHTLLYYWNRKYQLTADRNQSLYKTKVQSSEMLEYKKDKWNIDVNIAFVQAPGIYI